MIGVFRNAGLAEFQQHFRDPRVIALRERVRMVKDDGVDAAYPQRWIGKVTVTTTAGRALTARVEEPRGDPGNTLSRGEIEDKAVRLAEWSGAATAAEMRGIAQRVFSLAESTTVGILLRADSQAREAAE